MAELVYIGNYDNRNDLRLDSNGVPISLSSVTKIDAKIGLVTVSSVNGATDLIRWNVVGYAVGEIRCKFGAVPGLSPGTWPCYFIAYEPTNPNGIVFGPVDFQVLSITQASV